MHELRILSGIFTGAAKASFVQLYSPIGCSMKKAVLVSIATFVFLGISSAQTSQAKAPAVKQELTQPQIMKVDDVHPGMKGIGYTVFEGTKPEPMGITVLGVLRNLNGPKSDVILVRLEGEKAQFTGVVAGMSGS